MEGFPRNPRRRSHVFLLNESINLLRCDVDPDAYELVKFYQIWVGCVLRTNYRVCIYLFCVGPA